MVHWFATISLLRVLLLSILWPLFWIARIALPAAFFVYSSWRESGHFGFSLLGMGWSPGALVFVPAFLFIPPLMLIGAWYIARRWAR